MEGIRQRLTKAARDVGLVVDTPGQEKADSLRIAAWENSPHSMILGWRGGDQVRLHGHVRAFGLSGDRSDIHDIVGGLWMLHLIATGQATVQIVDELHEFAVNEIYARHLIVDPPGPLTEDGIVAWAATMFRATAASSPAIAANFDDHYPETCAEKQPVWIPAVAAITGDDLDNGELTIGHRMQGAMWQHFRSFTKKVSVYRLSPGNMEALRRFLDERASSVEASCQKVREAVEQGENRELLAPRIELARSISAAVNQSVGVAGGEPILVWLRSHIVAVGAGCVVEVAWAEHSDDEEDDE